MQKEFASASESKRLEAVSAIFSWMFVKQTENFASIHYRLEGILVNFISIYKTLYSLMFLV